MAHDEVVQDLVGKGKWMSEVSYDNMKMLRIQINSSHVTKDFPTSKELEGQKIILSDHVRCRLTIYPTYSTEAPLSEDAEEEVRDVGDCNEYDSRD